MSDQEGDGINQAGFEIQEQIRVAVLERKQIKASLTRFITFLSKFTDDKLENLQCRLQNMPELLNSFTRVQSKLESLSLEEEQDSTERESFEDKYFQAVGNAKKVSAAARARLERSNTSTPASLTSEPPLNVTLNEPPAPAPAVKGFPPIDLIKFYGDYEKWPQFHDLFLTLVHNDKHIDNIRKFYYLLSSLKGDAAQVLESIQVTSENYQIAWNILKERYENPTLSIKNHIRGLFSLQNVSKDTKFTLRNLIDDFQKRYRALELLGEPVSHWDTLLIFMLTSKLDNFTSLLWEEHLIKNKLQSPKLTVLLEFLTDRCKLLETTNFQPKSDSHNKQNWGSKGQSQNNAEKVVKKSQAYASTQNEKTKTFEPKCVYCKGSHFIYRCEKFAALPVAARIPEIKKLKICENCFRSNHETKDCNSQGCRVCSAKGHNTMLHSDSQSNSETTKSESLGVVVNHSIKNEPEILLSTASVLIRDKFGNWQQCTALLDSGAQPNFISENLFKKLQLNCTTVEVPVAGVGTSSALINKLTKTNIKSHSGMYSTDVSFLVLEKITEKLPVTSFKKSLVNIPANITLSDPKFNCSKEIDILLGSEIFYNILGTQKISLGDNQPILFDTVFGWIVSGPLLISKNHKRRVCNLSVNCDLTDKIEKFWQIENGFSEPVKHVSAEESQCETIFNETTKRDVSGRFVVNLPLRQNVGPLGDSFEAAQKRLFSIERKCKRNPEFKQQYTDFMREYMQLNHMEKIENPELTNENNSVYYLPHHGVVNLSSTTTSLRVVFDGSCPTSTGLSLNDTLMVGPCIQDDLFSILLRFRKYPIVITADCAKMYRQVSVSANHTDLQRILWRENPDDEISHFRLLTVTYGTSSASYLATRALQQTAIENKSFYPKTSDVILRDFYVDDLISGADSPQEASQLKNEISHILNSYGFTLRKWLSNDVTTIEKDTISSDDQYYIHENEVKKTLGLIWHAKLDVLTYNINTINPSKKLTKRTLLSSISTIFDPLGLLSPVIIPAKILMQKLWQCKLGWDDPVPQEIYNEWLKFCTDLVAIKDLKIHRHVLIKNPERIELHLFCDSSQAAFGACAYIRSVDKNGVCRVQNLCSKSRVAPLKTVTIPRLELCGALVATQLYVKIRDSIDLKFDEVYFWTDSTIVLAWLALSPSSLKLFVANRVAEIQRHTIRSQWGHVSTHENPADLLSRGVRPNELEKSKIWWSGPDWLSKGMELWPTKNAFSHPDSIPEIKNVNVTMTTTVTRNDFPIFSKFSTLFRLQRVVALCLRFSHNCKNKNNKTTGNFTVSEIDKSLNVILKMAQREMFPEEVQLIEKSKPLSTKSKLLSFSPFIGADGLLRIGGRLNKSKLAYDSRHQIILSSAHPLTKLIVLDAHHKNLHAGILLLLNLLRQKYWIVHGRRAVRSILSKCITCFKVNPRRMVQKMGDLPIDRVSQYRPFYVTGVDFAGPFNIKDGKLRNRATVKAYLCIFICFASKAVHLEAVSDLSTDAFLNALKRFVSRRGISKSIYSDNATNFCGANNELKQICEKIPKFVQERETSDFLLQNAIKWNFIPARSPHHGGLWECAVKRAKYHIYRVIGKSLLTFEQISTLFSQVEAALNSSPLTPLSEDPSDFSALTPGHLLIGEPLLTIPQHDLTELLPNRLNQFERLQQMFQLFWQRWSRDYLLNMQQRTKWKTDPENCLKIDSMVLLIDDNLPPMCWRMGRVIQLLPGKDNKVRVVRIKTSTGETTRAVQKLCSLPIEY